MSNLATQDGPAARTAPGTTLIDTDLQDKVAIVTGAAGGVGRAVVELLVGRGARVVAQDIDEAVGALTSEHVAAVVGDVADPEVAQHGVARALEVFGKLDVLVNNAGRTLNSAIGDTSDEDWDLLMRVNARGNFVQSRAAFRFMATHGGGSIVSVTSISASIALPLTSAYSASKGAITALTRVLAIEGAPVNVRANSVAPGVIDTGFLNGIRSDGQEYLRSFGSAHPLGRIASPRDVAEAVAYLASDRASFVTGTTLTVDGGFTAQ